MVSWQDEAKDEFNKLRKQFGSTSREDFESGEWFSKFVRWMLENYSKEVDARYFRRKYPGAPPAEQAKKVIELTSKYNAVAGGAAAAAITALEVSALGPQAAIAIPAAATIVMADIAFTTRSQLRSTYDLSVIHGAPLEMDDVEDCYLIFLASVGIKLGELVGGLGKQLGPKVVAYRVRKLLKSGVRKALQQVLVKIGGRKVASKLTERAMMRLLVPGIGIPISAGFNYFSTRATLNIANSMMRRRGRVVQPLQRMFARKPKLDRVLPVKAYLAIVGRPDREGWAEEQMDGLRYLQAALRLRDEALAKTANYLDRDVADLRPEVAKLEKPLVTDLIDLLVVGAALDSDATHDACYAEEIQKLATLEQRPRSAAALRRAIGKTREQIK